MRYSVGEIAKILEGETRGKSDIIVSAVTINSKDSRRNSLFFALPGKHVDGHEFVEDAYIHGAVCAVVNRWIDVSVPISQIRVKDTLKALGTLARHHVNVYKKNIEHILTITGSNGKTTTKEMIAAILSTKFKIAKTSRSYNTEYGLPYTILNEIDDETQFCVFEFGVQYPGDIRYLAHIVPYDLTVITNIGLAHIGTFENLENLMKEKISIVENLNRKGVAFLNADDTRLSNLRKSRDDVKYIYFGISSDKRISVPTHLIDSGLDFIVMEVFYQDKWRKLKMRIGGRYNASNCAAALSVASYFDIPWESVKFALERFTGVMLRWDVREIGDSRIILDCYNANPVSVKAAIRSLVNISANKRYLVLGDMLELGVIANEEHESLGEFISHIDGIDGILLFDSPLTRHIERGINGRKKVFRIHGIEELAKRLREILRQGDITLIKASRKIELERVLDYL